jgi:hypothetical protein
MKKALALLIAAPACFVLAGAAARQFNFETEARVVCQGRSPKVVARRAHGVLMTYTARSDSGQGHDLFFQSSSDVGDAFESRQRINSEPGEVSDHGENSPQLLTSPDDSTLYAVWNSRDAKNPMGSHVRFSRSAAMRPAWSPAITVNDDLQPVSHGFQTAAVGPDGTIYAAWLDGRNRAERQGDPAAHHHSSGKGVTGGTSDVYLARSADGGRAFEKNVRIAGRICPCCRPAIGFSKGRVIVAWRQVDDGDIRDIYAATSSDKGATWGAPARVARDNWAINGCPHVGPALATLGDRLYVAWFSEGSNEPSINLAWSNDGGNTFSVKRPVSEGTVDPTHPQLAATQDRLALVFQARDAATNNGWGKMAAYYREIYSDGSLSPLVLAGRSEAGASYPTVALGMSGRIFVGWTQGGEGGFQGYLVRGRSEVSGVSRR